MKVFNTSYLVAMGLIVAGLSQAQALTAVKPLFGYKCMSVNVKMLNATPEDLWNGKGLPPVYAEPSDRSQQLGTNGDVVVVGWPLNEVNGFARIMRLNGQTAWISSKVLQPYVNANGTAGACTPSLMSNGSIGFKFSAK